MNEPSKEKRLPEDHLTINPPECDQSTKEHPENNESGQTDRKPGIVQMFLSAAAAAFGVQNSKTRERDFSSGNPLAFILVGLIFTVALVLSIVLVVSLVLR